MEVLRVEVVVKVAVASRATVLVEERGDPLLKIGWQNPVTALMSRYETGWMALPVWAYMKYILVCLFDYVSNRRATSAEDVKYEWNLSYRITSVFECKSNFHVGRNMYQA